MKATAFLLLLTGMAVFSANASTTIITDLSQDYTSDIAYAAPTEGSSLGYATGDVSLSMSIGSTTRYPSSITINLNLTEMQAAIAADDFETTLLLDLRTSQNDTSKSIGLVLTSTGLNASWKGSAWVSSASLPVTMDTLSGLSYSVDGTSYVTLTLLAVVQSTSGAVGTTILDANGNGVKASNGNTFSLSGLTTDSKYKAVAVNTDYVTGLAITPGVATTEEVIAASSAVSLASVPEPTTATLSLLGLAGLMLRRRR